MLRLKNIRKVFNEGTVNEKVALDGVTLTVEDGEFATIVGSNGAGKSTLFNCIGGSFFADEGSIYLDDRNITYVPEHKRAVEIGRLFQDPMKGTAPHMTIEENIGYVLSLTKQESSLIQKRVKEMMDIMKLEEQLLNRYPDELSGGQKQRVGIARALASHPKILLMDEPFGAVDEITRHSLQDEILRIYHELHITIFFITHDIREALRLGTRVMIMKDGNIEQFDTPGVVKKQPQTEFVRQLLSYLNE